MTIATRNPSCTHCGYLFTDEDIFFEKIKDFPVNDGEVETIVCPSCHKELYVTCEAILHWEVEEQEY